MFLKKIFNRPKFKKNQLVMLCPTFGGSRKAKITRVYWDEALEEWRYDLSFFIFKDWNPDRPAYQNTRYDTPAPRATDWAERSLMECPDTTGI